MPSNAPITTLEELRSYLVDFAKKRDWQQFQHAKNLSMALSVEVAELVEHFQWLTPEESDILSTEKHREVAEEIADVQMYLVLLADRLNVDILQAASQKTLKNEQKYPVEEVKGQLMKDRIYPKREQ